jgi:succinate dehydrogenase / fumarate reductase cytochrome b subunit
MSDTPTIKDRPLSPHLQVYKPQITSMTSIFHRMSGVALALGLFMVSWALIALATGEEAYGVFTGFCASIIGQIILIGWSAAFFYHICTGIRHLIRDCGYLYENKHSVISGWIVLIAAFFMTAAVWGYVYRDILLNGGAL